MMMNTIILLMMKIYDDDVDDDDEYSTSCSELVCLQCNDWCRSVGGTETKAVSR